MINLCNYLMHPLRAPWIGLDVTTTRNYSSPARQQNKNSVWWLIFLEYSLNLNAT